ncbi:hypothetical protein [Bdellovibrio bacteriovorus]|uniref:hypothetical protein n=1 Tax=Bdellovibrio bacteriovorus TaxID=959 RepID=UPI0035A6CF25
MYSLTCSLFGEIVKAGTCILIAGRPSIGKTLLAFNLIAQNSDKEIIYFATDWQPDRIYRRINMAFASNGKKKNNRTALRELSSLKEVLSVQQPSIIIVDYLNGIVNSGSLGYNETIKALKNYAVSSECILIILTQQNRLYQGESNYCFSIADISGVTNLENIDRCYIATRPSYYDKSTSDCITLNTIKGSTESKIVNCNLELCFAYVVTSIFH